MPDYTTCPHLHRIERLEKRADDNESTHGKIYDRLRMIENVSARTDEKLAGIVTTLARVEKMISDQAEKPARRWDIVITALISSAVTAVVTIVAANIFK